MQVNFIYIILNSHLPHSVALSPGFRIRGQVNANVTTACNIMTTLLPSRARSNLLPKESDADVLGKGAFAIVRVATRKQDGLKCAVKVVERTKLPDDGMVVALRKEAELLQQLNHDNIVKLHDWYEQDTSCLYMILELCEGEAETRISLENTARSVKLVPRTEP